MPRSPLICRSNDRVCEVFEYPDGFYFFILALKNYFTFIKRKLLWNRNHLHLLFWHALRTGDKYCRYCGTIPPNFFPIPPPKFPTNIRNPVLQQVVAVIRHGDRTIGTRYSCLPLSFSLSLSVPSVRVYLLNVYPQLLPVSVGRTIMPFGTAALQTPAT